MRARELRAALADLPDDMKVSGHLDRGRHDGKVGELRDIVHNYGESAGKLAQTAFVIGSNPHGFPHLTDEIKNVTRDSILDGLADAFRVEKWATRRFMANGDQWLIYNYHGGSEDWKYGTTYDPRVWLELEAEGLIARREYPGSYTFMFYLTEKGMERVTIRKLA